MSSGLVEVPVTLIILLSKILFFRTLPEWNPYTLGLFLVKGMILALITSSTFSFHARDSDCTIRNTEWMTVKALGYTQRSNCPSWKLGKSILQPSSALYVWFSSHGKQGVGKSMEGARNICENEMGSGCRQSLQLDQWAGKGFQTLQFRYRKCCM